MTVDMEYRPLGRCGTKVSALSIGGWTTYGALVKNQDTIEAVMKAAFDGGINFFDIADTYAKGECERVMGRVLKEFPRNELVISSKVYFPITDDVNDRGLSRKHIMESIDKSLRNIGTDYLDLYFCHRFDENTPLEETVRAMDDLVHQGKVLYWGTSEWSGEQLLDANYIADKRNLYFPQVEQPQYSLLFRHKYETNVRPVVREKGMGTVVWSPLASGVLTGKYDDGLPDGSRLGQIDWLKDKLYQEEILEPVRKMKSLADQLGCSRAQLALAWAMGQKGISSVITGATRVEQLEENLKAVELEIPNDVMAQLNELFPCIDRISQED